MLNEITRILLPLHICLDREVILLCDDSIILATNKGEATTVDIL